MGKCTRRVVSARDFSNRGELGCESVYLCFQNLFFNAQPVVLTKTIFGLEFDVPRYGRISFSVYAAALDYFQLSTVRVSLL
jgi:hypothetical protein